ncbi:retinoid-inducible serine carboxypeptidase-like isoform X2 [Halichondria panicea]|uniref:retinoid-inducible serine carboxypeptidase-like isoform X2 n=1 Tax=Halichondria panicea TaxID=6063 RepID=UPI00312BAAF3
MFWWLYGCKNREQVPLVLWLQGGPGSSSTGFGNFMEIGPLDINLKPRNTTWTQATNILFIDNPVGTGYSYVDDDSAYTTDVAEIAKDLLSLFSAFLKTHSVFQKMPFYIFCESYGGKMTTAFAEVLQEAINAGNVSVVFKGVGLGDSWISAIDYVNMWGPYLFATSLVNEVELARIQNYSKQTEAAFNNGDYARSTELWSQTEDVIEALTDDVDFYNTLRHNDDEVTSLQSGRGLPRILQRYNAQSLSQLMNGPIKQKLHIPDKVVWGSQVFEKQKVDFMKDVIGTVDQLLSMQGKCDCVQWPAGPHLLYSRHCGLDGQTQVGWTAHAVLRLLRKFPSTLTLTTLRNTLVAFIRRTKTSPSIGYSMLDTWYQLTTETLPSPCCGGSSLADHKQCIDCI